MRLRQSETHSLLEKIKQLQAEGLSYRQIENRLGIDKSKISRMLRKSMIMQQKQTQIPNDFTAFCDTIPYPLHPKTRIKSPLTDYQLDIHNAINEHHLIQINKARQIGCTSIILIHIAFESLAGRYRDGEVYIVSGSTTRHSRKLLRILKQILEPYKDHIVDSTQDTIELDSNCIITAMPSTDFSNRGSTLRAIHISESAHFHKVDSETIFSALMPSIITSDGDLIIESTPNGLNWFYDLWVDNDNGFHKIQLDYTVGLGKLYEQADIDKAKKSKVLNWEAEYCCKFQSGSNTIFSQELVDSACVEDYKLLDLDEIVYGNKVIVEGV